jgi:hypothetical protein
MKRSDFLSMMEEDFKELVRLNQTKGNDYSHADDAFDNFRRHARELALRPEQVWSVYAAKHWDAILTYVREGDVKSEPIEGRIHDLILYLFLLLGFVSENPMVTRLPVPNAIAPVPEPAA